jgi:hypothetical protein
MMKEDIEKSCKNCFWIKRKLNCGQIDQWKKVRVEPSEEWHCELMANYDYQDYLQNPCMILVLSDFKPCSLWKLAEREIE